MGLLSAILVMIAIWRINALFSLGPDGLWKEAEKKAEEIRRKKKEAERTKE